MLHFRRAASLSVFVGLATSAHRGVTTRSFSMSQHSYSPPPMVVEPSAKHTASVILIHGLGDTAEGWIDVAESLAGQLPQVRFVLPTASEKPVSLNHGMIMPSCEFIHGLACCRRIHRN